eukprot:758640-Hanusia_phi.AAC.1
MPVISSSDQVRITDRVNKGGRKGGGVVEIQTWSRRNQVKGRGEGVRCERCERCIECIEG